VGEPRICALKVESQIIVFYENVYRYVGSVGVTWLLHRVPVFGFKRYFFAIALGQASQSSVIDEHFF